MTPNRRHFLQFLSLVAWRGSSSLAADLDTEASYLGQGTLCGEVSTSTAILQTRLTSSAKLDASGDLP